MYEPTRALCPIVVSLLSLVAGCAPSGGFRVIPVSADQSLRVRVVDRESAWISAKIALIDIEGVITDQTDDGMFGSGENPMALTIEKINAAAKDDTIKAVVLRINSPGGTVTASDILYQELLRFRKNTGKPVVASLMDLGTSGAYYIACAADEILAHPTTITGSIGVIMQTISMRGTLDKVGMKTDAITSGPMKAAGSPFKDLQPEEREIFQKVVDNLYEKFIGAVSSGRPKLDRAKILSLADGRIYTADQAVENGLVDGIGTVRDAIAAAKRRAGVDRANSVLFTRPLGWRASVYAQSEPTRPTGGTTINLLNLNTFWDWTGTPRFLYLWRLQ